MRATARQSCSVRVLALADDAGDLVDDVEVEAQRPVAQVVEVVVVRAFQPADSQRCRRKQTSNAVIPFEPKGGCPALREIARPRAGAREISLPSKLGLPSR